MTNRPAIQVPEEAALELMTILNEVVVSMQRIESGYGRYSPTEVAQFLKGYALAKGGALERLSHARYVLTPYVDAALDPDLVTEYVEAHADYWGEAEGGPP